MCDECITEGVRRCTKCGETKALEAFYFADKEKRTYQSRCKQCMIEASKERHRNNPEYSRQAWHKRFADDSDKIRAQKKAHRDANLEEERAKERVRDARRRPSKQAYREANAEQIKERNAAYRDEHREQIRDDGRAYYAANKAKIAERQRAWREAHSDRNRAIRRQSKQKHATERLAYNRAYRNANPDLYRLAYQRRRARQLSRDDGTVTVAAWQEQVAYFGGCCAYCGTPIEAPEQEHMLPLSRGGAHSMANLVPACRACNARKSDKTLAEFLLMSV